MLTRDFQTSVLTEDGELVFLGPNLQYFSNSHSLTVKWTLEHRSDNPGIGPGDVFLVNDPFVGVPHQPDTALLAPVFLDGSLFQTSIGANPQLSIYAIVAKLASGLAARLRA